LAAFAAALVAVVMVAVVQVIPRHTIHSALGQFGHGSSLAPFIVLGLLVAARSARNSKK
jgi:hypothetical protein